MAALLLALFGSATAEVWRFGLIGDVPYSASERRELPLMITAMSAQQVAFIAHVGDIKNGKDRCEDSLFEDRLVLFNTSRVPFILVPGDNEWTDCERVSNGAFNPEERLAKLRSLFWNDGFSLGQLRMPLERQTGVYREHSRFRVGPVLFVTLNLPGSNNNFGLTDQPRPEYLARNPATLDWLSENFALARQEKLAGIVLLFQANPGFGHFSQGLVHRGYREFLEKLHGETIEFPGKVVVVHGDTHISRIDHPLRNTAGMRLTNFTRVETFGYPVMGWTLGIIDTDSAELFRFEANPWPPKPLLAD